MAQSGGCSSFKQCVMLSVPFGAAAVGAVPAQGCAVPVSQTGKTPAPPEHGTTPLTRVLSHLQGRRRQCPMTFCRLKSLQRFFPTFRCSLAHWWFDFQNGRGLSSSTHTHPECFGETGPSRVAEVRNLPSLFQTLISLGPRRGIKPCRLVKG